MGLSISVDSNNARQSSDNSGPAPLHTPEFYQFIAEKKKETNYDPVKKCSNFYTVYQKCYSKYGDWQCKSFSDDLVTCSLVAGLDTPENQKLSSSEQVVVLTQKPVETTR
jgi:hypothetical protein